MNPPFVLRCVVLALPLAMLGCAQTTKNEAPGPSAQNTGLAPQQQRITEEKILADRQTLEALQLRLRKLNEAGISQNNFALSKAQCWLDTAKTQYHENDRTGYIEESMAESQKIIQALESNRNTTAGQDTPLVARSERLRDDLWAELAKYKSNASTLLCNARTVACGEIRLVRAGHAQEQTGWRAATPHIMMAEDSVRRAAQEAQACAPVAPNVAVAAAAPMPVAASPATAPTPAAQVTRETFVLLGDALFKFDRSGREEMLPGGRERIAEIVKKLKSYQSISSLTVEGHTDRLGSEAYNNALSQRRATTVLEYMSALGVSAATTQASGKGKSQPVTKSCSDKLSREELIVCLQADRRVTIQVTGIVK